MIRHHADFGSGAFGLEPVAHFTGPFARRPFLETLWKHRRRPGEELWVVENGSALVAMTRGEGWVGFVGESDLVDYHAPLGEQVAELMGEAIASLPTGTELVFDSMPQAASEVMGKGLAEAGVAADLEQHAVAAVVDLPGDFDDYLGGLDKKERHELRRKARRFDDRWGPARVVSMGPEGLPDFLRMHRLASGAKGRFMTSEMEGLFADLVSLDGWQIDVLCGLEGPAAAAFSYVDATGHYLYNAAYDPAAAAGSPGIVLLGRLIARAIADGRQVFDFMKGDEPYKFRLGARPRPLFRLVGRR